MAMSQLAPFLEQLQAQSSRRTFSLALVKAAPGATSAGRRIAKVGYPALHSNPTPQSNFTWPSNPSLPFNLPLHIHPTLCVDPPLHSSYTAFRKVWESKVFKFVMLECNRLGPSGRLLGKWALQNRDRSWRRTSCHPVASRSGSCVLQGETTSLTTCHTDPAARSCCSF